jgi:hypothetical protein
MPTTTLSAETGRHHGGPGHAGDERQLADVLGTTGGTSTTSGYWPTYAGGNFALPPAPGGRSLPAVARQGAQPAVAPDTCADGDIPLEGCTAPEVRLHSASSLQQPGGPDRAEAAVDHQAAHRTFLHRTESLVREGLVCEEAGCPNIECWEDREATFLIGGTSAPGGDFARSTRAAAALDEGEPRRVAESVAAMGLKYATVTGAATT